MELKFDVKNVPSVVVLTHLNKRIAGNLEQTAYELCNEAEVSGSESLFCLIEKPHLHDDVEVQVCCPIHDVDLAYHEKKYKIEVLPRQLVLSVVHYGEYNDLKPIFEKMFRYIEKNKLTVSPVHRVLFHREKREWDREKLNKKPAMDYITEIQIQILDK